MLTWLLAEILRKIRKTLHKKSTHWAFIATTATILCLCVRLRQRSHDGDCVPVVMRDTIGFLSEQGESSSALTDWKIQFRYRHNSFLLLFLCLCRCVRFGDRGHLQALGQRDVSEGRPTQIQLRLVHAERLYIWHNEPYFVTWLSAATINLRHS